MEAKTFYDLLDEYEEKPEQGLIIENVTLTGLELEGRILADAQFMNVHFTQVNLRGAHLQRVKFQNIQFKETILDGAQLTDSKLYSVDLAGASLKETDCCYAFFHQVNLLNANMAGVLMVKATIEASTLDNALFDKAKLRRSYIVNSSLKGIQLTATDLFKTYFINVDLRNANFRNAEMERASLEYVKLFGVTGFFEDKTTQIFLKNLDFSENGDGSDMRQLVQPAQGRLLTRLTSLDDPKSIWGKSPEEIQKAFQEAGYEAVIESSTKGSRRSVQIRIKGHRAVSNIQVHPGGGRHGGAYYKISTSTQGKIKVVDRTTYKPTAGEKVDIIYKD